MVTIVQYPSQLLQRKGKYVNAISEVKVEIDQMLTLLAKQEACAALAATQLSFDCPHRIVVFNLPDPQGNVGPWGLINPVITMMQGKQKGKEGCMSIINVFAEVTRASIITVKGFSLTGIPLQFTATDFLARCIQHEVDHLKGILYLDRLGIKARRELERKIHEQAQKTNTQTPDL